MAHNPVGVNSTFGISTSSAQGVVAHAHQSDTLRVVAVGAGAHVAIGTNPTATAKNYFIASGNESTISIGRPSSQRVVGIITGTATTLDFPEGTGSPFAVGDAVSLTVTGQPYYDFTHQMIASIDNSSGVSGYYGTRITVNYDSSGIVTAFNSPYAELRGSFKVAALGSGSGSIHYQQVQITGNA